MNIKLFIEKYSPYFFPNEKWGDIHKIKENHLDELLAIRKEMALPMVIHCSYEESGHSENSFHYRGLATDFHFVTKMHIMKQSMMLECVLKKIGIRTECGLGIYPEWNNPGFHFDSRGYISRWIKENGKYRYF